ncbi:MAG: hypothetical protein ACO1QB_15685 [Verrucomicrobiales bacterium]
MTRLLLLIGGLLALPITAHANTGTPLMWGTALHLVFGNAIIGVAEGYLIARLFNLSKNVCVSLMIAANYLSAWCGFYIIGQAKLSAASELHLYNAWPWYWKMVFFTFFVTLALEWPFVALCFRKRPLLVKRSLKANLLVQSTSYLLLFSWYSMVSYKSIYTNLETVPPEAINTSTNIGLYFISDSDGDVYSSDLQGRNLQQAFKLSSSLEGDRLVVESDSPGQWNLLALIDETQDGKMILLATNLMGHIVEAADILLLRNRINTHRNFGKVPSLAPTNSTRYRTGYWPFQGILVLSDNPETNFLYSLETPFIHWKARNATQVDRHQVIFQLGKNQICLLDSEQKKIALIARGRGPVVFKRAETKAFPETTLPSPE